MDKITNGEFYKGKSDKELRDMLEESLCDFCQLDEDHRGCHCYGGEPVFYCEENNCIKALNWWKEEYYENE